LIFFANIVEQNSHFRDEAETAEVFAIIADALIASAEREGS
jgi:hypothetical protein